MPRTRREEEGIVAWFKVDDALPAHHKVLSIPRGARRLAAIGAWTLAGAWTSANLKEGLIPKPVVEELGIPGRAVADLVAAGLWIEVPGAYQMHDYLDYNPTAEQVLYSRVGNARRQALVRDPELKSAIRERDADRCRYCGQMVVWTDRRSPSGGTYDHVDPDGPNTLGNLVVACRGCNSSKGRRTLQAAGITLLTPGSLGPVTKSYLVTDSEPDLDTTKAPTRPDPTRSSSNFQRDVDVELREPAITSSITPPARPALRAVETVECRHHDPHPELCQLCRRESRSA
jgi:hypothetical protein